MAANNEQLKDEEKNPPSTYRQAAQVHPDFRKHDIQV